MLSMFEKKKFHKHCRSNKSDAFKITNKALNVAQQNIESHVWRQQLATQFMCAGGGSQSSLSLAIVR